MPRPRGPNYGCSNAEKIRRCRERRRGITEHTSDRVVPDLVEETNAKGTDTDIGLSLQMLQRWNIDGETRSSPIVGVVSTVAGGTEEAMEQGEGEAAGGESIHIYEANSLQEPSSVDAALVDLSEGPDGTYQLRSQDGFARIVVRRTHLWTPSSDGRQGGGPRPVRLSERFVVLVLLDEAITRAEELTRVGAFTGWNEYYVKRVTEDGRYEITFERFK